MKRVLITGAAKGLGKKISQDLVSKGFDVIVHYRNSKKEALEMTRGLEANSLIPVFGDFDSKEGVEAFIQRVKDLGLNIDILINNVGNFEQKDASSTSLDDLQNLYQSNFFAPFALAKAFSEDIKASKGQIINIGYAGLENRMRDSFAFAYFLTKQSLLSWSKTLAKEMIPYGVRVNMVSPGHLENTIVNIKNKKDLLFSRLASLDEFSKAVLFLLSDDASYVTGQNLEVAGGALL
ncbi:3-oxoacyl-[acyl-carrier-protein] reductase FabG [Chlamydiales bacterium SCGC AB-751-O23]|jgi:NAD(P)-dependent dehydrogenase (short-subunit alcohol dehydrogenase family)|nr:3-oxoacyl-[acyl-carrier-protein] reductase FabG [Chlamydiales bacterium SCGC AB-751-O23]